MQAHELVIRAEMHVAFQAERDLGLIRPLDRRLVRRPGHLRMSRGEAAVGDQDRRVFHSRHDAKVPRLGDVTVTEQQTADNMTKPPVSVPLV